MEAECLQTGAVLARRACDGICTVIAHLVPRYERQRKRFCPLKCCRELRRVECVLTTDGSFVLPCMAVLVSSVDEEDVSGRVTLLTADLLTLLGLRFVHPCVQLPPALANEIGVRVVDASLLRELLVAVCARQDGSVWKRWSCSRKRKKLSPEKNGLAFLL